jgi:peptide/nickel transport system substrate-binding protein
MKSAGFNRNPVGDGPFKFKSWTPQQSIEIVANESFFRGRPHLNGVVWRIIPEWTSLITQLQRGDVDLLTGIQPNYYQQLKSDPDLDIYSAPGRRYVYIAWNLKEPLFADRNVRRALSMAVDRQAIIDALLYGQGKVMNGPFPSVLWAYDPDIKPIPYDADEARRLLDQAGWKDTNGDGVLDKDGRPFRFELLTNSDNTLRMDMTVAIQSQLKKLGIDARPRGLEFVTFVGKLNNKDFQAAVGGWNSQIKVDLSDLWSSKSIEDKFNFISYANQAVDSLIDMGTKTFDTDQAKRIWGEAQQIISDDAGYTFLFEQYDINALDKRFHGVEMNAGGWDYNVEEWYVPKNEQKY